MLVIPVFKAVDEEDLQMLKIKEENDELILAWLKNENKERLLEECFDNIQAVVNLMFMIADKKEIKIAGAKHFEKMKNRGYEFEKLIRIGDDF